VAYSAWYGDSGVAAVLDAVEELPEAEDVDDDEAAAVRLGGKVDGYE
jgi:hypothetical protein